MSLRSLPTPAELDDAPELAILGALHETLDLALRALLSAHPQLGDSECPHWVRQTSPAREAAERILDAARPLATALETYRQTVAIARDDPDDADRPF